MLRENNTADYGQYYTQDLGKDTGVRIYMVPAINVCVKTVPYFCEQFCGATFNSSHHHLWSSGRAD